MTAVSGTVGTKHIRKSFNARDIQVAQEKHLIAGNLSWLTRFLAAFRLFR